VLADALPPTLAGWVERGAGAPPDVGDFSVEQVAAVCRVLAETLTPSVLKTLVAALPAELAAHFRSH
jgi:hypothetical protein